jgi:hypothetical protein
MVTCPPLVKVVCFTWSHSLVESGSILDQSRKLADVSSPEDLHDAMLDRFADFSAASVLLVFEDGEQRCHTFPLAARDDTV